MDQMLAWLKELEELLQFPTVAGHVERAERLATLIARGSGEGRIANLAMQVVSEMSALRNTPLALRPDRARLNQVLWHLRFALAQAKSVSASGSASGSS